MVIVIALGTVIFQFLKFKEGSRQATTSPTQGGRGSKFAKAGISSSGDGQQGKGKSRGCSAAVEMTSISVNPAYTGDVEASDDPGAAASDPDRSRGWTVFDGQIGELRGASSNPNPAMAAESDGVGILPDTGTPGLYESSADGEDREAAAI